MRDSQQHQFGYYFLNKRLGSRPPKGFREDLVLLIINKNPGPNFDKYLLVRQNNKVWGLPKEGVKALLADDLFNTIAKNLEQELGLKGANVFKLNPKFELTTILFNFAKQIYDMDRSKDEVVKNRPNKGKVYHLIIMNYLGKDTFPVDSSREAEIIDHCWVNESAGSKLLEENKLLVTNKIVKSIQTIEFGISLWRLTIKTYRNLCLTIANNSDQPKLF